MIVVGWLMLAGSVQANDLAPVALQSVTPDRSWFYNLEEVVFDADESYVPNGYIAWTKWYIEGVEQTQGSYYHNMSVCFALYGSPEGDCYELDQGKTTVQIKLMVQSNYGYWDEQTITYTIKEHKGRKYFVKDHLGSVRTTVNRDGNVLGYDDYYPFGLAMPGRSSNSANPNDDYKFTGHELDNEAGLNLINMNARMLDPVIGRTLQIDPMAAKYPGLSPFAYVANNPVNAFDPDGRLIIFINGQNRNNAGMSYWRKSGFDVAVMNHTNDFNPMYRDGSLGGWRNTLSNSYSESNLDPTNRYDAGYDQAMEDFDMITAKLAPEETIKIITHSMGSMYGRGYVAALKKLINSSNDPAIQAIKIEFIADFAPYDPDSYGAIKGENIGPTLQFSHCGDFIAGCKASPGAENQDTSEDENQTHWLEDFMGQIENLPAGRYIIRNGKIVKEREEQN